jgi:hypothetical protein
MTRRRRPEPEPKGLVSEGAGQAESAFDPKRTSLVLSNDRIPNDLSSIWVLLIGMMQTALIGQHAVKLAKTCKSH